MRLIKGDLDYTCRIGTTRIGIVPLEAPAPAVDAVVIEQDTHCLLAVEPSIIEPEENLTQMANQLSEFVPYKGGAVVVKRAEPLQLFAIVHDLDLAPSWQETWIAAALDATLKLAGERHLKRLGMAPLGTLHGHFPLERFIELLVAGIARHREGAEQIWLGVKRSHCHSAIEQLKHYCTNHQSRF